MCALSDRGGLGREAVLVAGELIAVGAYHQARSDLDMVDLAGEEHALHGDRDLFYGQFGCSDPE